MKKNSLSNMELLLKLKEKASSSLKPYFFTENPKQDHLPKYLGASQTCEEKLFKDSDEILNLIKPLLLGFGKIKQTPCDQVYLDISDDFIQLTKDFFSIHGGSIPSLQPHISVISPKEWQETGSSTFTEIGKSYPFKISGCYEVTTPGWREAKKVWLLKVYSEELENLRKKYNLCPKIHGRDFHILLSIYYETNLDKHEPFLSILPTVYGV